MKTIFGCSLILVLSFIVAPVYADDYQDGIEAYKQKDYKTALEKLKPLAEQGNAEAQVKIGLMYGYGRGVPKDNKKRVEWYRKAADQGNAKGQFNLGYMYEKGKGVQQDSNQTALWYTKAANQGYVKAQFKLGWMYDKGQGVKQDYDEAFKWYRKAAEQGHAGAQVNLGLMYEEGEGVPQDYQEAKKLYRKAAAQGDRIAKKNLKSLSRKEQIYLLPFSLIFILIVISALSIIFFRGDKKSGPYGRLFFSSLCAALLLLGGLQFFSQDSGWNEEQIEFWETQFERTAKKIESSKTTYSQYRGLKILLESVINILERQIYDSGPIGSGILCVGIALVLIWFAKKQYSLLQGKKDASRP